MRSLADGERSIDAQPARTAGTTKWLALALSGVLLVYAVVVLYAPRYVLRGFRKPVVGTPADVGLAYERVAFPTADGVTIVAWWIAAPSPKGAIILVHGGGDNRNDPYLGTQAIAARLVTAGYAALAIDLRGHGDSADPPDGRLSMGSAQARDVSGAVDWLAAEHAGLPVGTLGGSLGGATVIFAGAQDRRIRATVAVDPVIDRPTVLANFIWAFAPIPHWMAAHVAWSTRTFYRDAIDFDAGDPIEAAADIEPTRLMLIQDVADPICSIATARRLRARCPGIEYWESPATADGSSATRWGSHVKAFHLHPDEFMARVLSFYARNFGPDAGGKRAGARGEPRRRS